MASLAITVDGVEQRFPLEAAAVTLGRGLESDIRLKDIKASRRHCQVVKTPKGYQCVDLSSGNGTYVNGVQIKQQMLDPGDRITIGSTTIVFEDAPKPAAKPAPAKGATGKVPAAAAPQAKTAPIKVATERVQVEPTRRSTARVEAAKAPSQGALKPAAAPPGKSGTRIKTGARTAGSRPPRPAPAPAEAPPKKGKGVLIALAAVVVLALGAGGWYFLGSKDDAEQLKTQIDQLVKKAAEAEKAEKLDAAVADYKKALDLCKGERFKVRASDIQKQLQLLEAHRGGATSPKPEPKDAPEKGPDFAARRAEISEKHKLADAAAANWGGALKDWREFLKAKPGDARSKAEAEIQALQGKAKDDLARVRRKADALAQENKMAEACDLLKQQLPRFEGTDLAELHRELEAAIKQHDK